ncbi:roundabout homolog 2-like isoform X2 [Babylonia areolata]|uniref:roundabout homolog 2-like isoform X2 n=1 Tax=Babylonia areolata TaxID=304850 RepID=UPI003FD5A656
MTDRLKRRSYGPLGLGSGSGIVGTSSWSSVLLLLVVGWLLALGGGARQAAAQGGAGGNLPNPRIVEHPTDDYVAKNEPAKLNCKAEGDPPPTITWYRNGERVVTSAENPSSHRMLLNNGQLFFLRIIHNKNSKPDVGSYYCNATNVHGSAISRNATLQLAVLRDDFRENPQPVTVAAGETATFHCKPPRGEPEPKVLWRRNGSPVANEGRITITDDGDLILAAVEPGDSGDYTCLALNKGGERESAPASLTVLEKPTFRQMPDDVIAKKDDTVELKCSATGDPRPTIQWQKEYGRIPFGRARQLDDGTLWIEKVEVSDDGVYVCIAENTAGTVKAVGRLTIHTMPSFLIKPTNQQVGRGRTATLQCVVNGNPPPTVFWSKGTEQHLMFPNHENGRYSVSEDGTLRIRDIQYEDEGQYVCQGLNVLGSEKAMATITVKDEDKRPPPMIVTGPQNQTLQLKEVAMLPCQAQGDPPPVIRWYKDGRPLLGTDPRVTILNSGTLQISDVRSGDTAVYTCTAISETGETSWRATLTAAKQGPFHRMPKPSAFPDPPSKPVVTGVDDTSVHLAWQGETDVAKSPVLAYLVDYFSYQTSEGWVRVTDSAQEESYTVHDLKPETSYIFVVRAQNAFGVSEPSPSSDPIEIQVTSTPPENIVIHKEDNTIHIRWSPPKSQHAGEVEGYEIYCIDDDRSHNCSVSTDESTSSVRIQDVDPDRTYRIRLAARTPTGVGVWSKTFVVGPEQSNIMKEPWFLGMLISTIGGTVWLALCIFSIWLCRKRKHKKKMAQNGMYSAVPVHKSEESRSGVVLSREDALYSQKDPHGTLGAFNYEDLTTLLDVGGAKDLQDGGGGGSSSSGVGGMYSVATGGGGGVGGGTLMPQMKTFYQKPSSTPVSVAPYATTTLINTSGAGVGVGGGTSGMAKPLQSSCLEATFRPINQAYVHSSASGSGDSCPKPGDVRSSDSNTDNSRPNTGHYPPPYAGCHHEGAESLISPGSDSGSLTTDENGMPVRRPPGKGGKVCPGAGKQPMVNWAELLPPPPEHPPPGGDLVTSAPDFPTNSLQRHHPHLAAAADGQRFDDNRSPISPVSKISACSCPVPHESLMHGMRGVPCYSDTEYAGGGPPHGPRYPDLRPYSPKQLSMRTQSPMAMMPGGVGGARMGAGGPPVGGPGMHPCHTCPPPAAAPAYLGGQGGMEGMCPHHHNYYSDIEQYRPRPGAGGLPAGPTSLHGYRMPPLEGGDPRMMLSDSEGHPHHMHMYPGVVPGMGEGPHMDRACQSSLPSLANECIHSPGYRSSRNADSPMSEELPDYAGESDIDAARTTDCPTPESSVNGEAGDGSISDTDFASAVARAAELSGMTVVGTTVTDPKANARRYGGRMSIDQAEMEIESHDPNSVDK